VIEDTFGYDRFGREIEKDTDEAATNYKAYYLLDRNHYIIDFFEKEEGVLTSARKGQTTI
jgi:hypothetical protein